MVKAVIVEDEPNTLSYLERLIELHTPELTLTGKATSVPEALVLIEESKPEIVFLDIELQTATGFDLLAQLKNLNFSLIFTTAHEKYAIKAIKFAAVDFLVKPIDSGELKIAVSKAIRQINSETNKLGLDVLLSNLRNKDHNKKIAIHTNKGITVVEVNRIYFCKSDGPYTELHTKDDLIVSSRHLKEYEDLLHELGFFRVHKSYLINLNEIKQYVRSDGGYVIMSNGEKVDVSDKRKEELLKKLSSGIISF